MLLVIDLDETSAIAYVNRNLYTSLGQFDLAIADYNKALCSLDPDLDTVYMHSRLLPRLREAGGPGTGNR